MKALFCYTIILCILLLAACNPQPEAAALLKQAESIIETHPDSAMLLIDSLFYPEKSLNRNQYMRFLVTQAQAKYKTYRPIDEDTLIFRARSYFSGRGKEPRMAALAWFYSGCVYRERKEYDNAMQHYDMAGGYGAAGFRGVLHGTVATPYRYCNRRLFQGERLFLSGGMEKSTGEL